MNLKIFAYNILDGFYTSWPSYRHQPERQKAALKVIEKEKPDILVLTEASFAFPSSYAWVQDYQKMFRYPHVAIGRSNDKSGTVILSKYPLKAVDYSINKAPFIRAVISCGQNKITLDVAHPHPDLSDWDKGKFFRSIIRDFQKPYILAGDFNTLSPQDPYDRAKLEKAFGTFSKNSKDAVSHVWGEMRPIKALLEAGLVDTFVSTKKKWTYTIPTKFLSPYNESGIRIDYIFCSDDLKVIDAGVLKNQLTEKASDHYPVYAVLELK